MFRTTRAAGSSRFRRVTHRICQRAIRGFYQAQLFCKKHVSNQLTYNINNKMRVSVIPALSDNYMYLLIDESTKQAAIVDPVEPEKVLEAVDKEGVDLVKVLTTHHHWDHAGGNEKLLKKYEKPLQVYGGDKRVGALTDFVKHGDAFTLGNINIDCLHTPCHTSGHICYFVNCCGYEPLVFTGDTLFIGGCGRFFEGTPNQMYTNLIEILGNLPENTKVFCGHEYTETNLRFALAVEEQNQDILTKLEWAKMRRHLAQPTVPSTIKEEKKTNPFMRVNEPAVRKFAGCDNPIEIMRVLRSKKDTLKYIP